MLHRLFHKVVGDPCMIHLPAEVVHLVEATRDNLQVAMIVLLLLELVVVAVVLVIMVPVVDSVVIVVDSIVVVVVVDVVAVNLYG